MKAQFKRLLMNGETPKQAFFASFRRAGQVVFPVNDTILFPQHFSKIIFYDDSDGYYLEKTGDVGSDDDQSFTATITTNDSIFIGLSVRYSGIKIDLSQVNSNASVMSAKYYSDDASAFAALTIIDGTDNGGDSFGQDGNITFRDPGDDWVKTKYKLGGNYYWIQLYFSANLTETIISEIKILGAQWGFKILNGCIRDRIIPHSSFNFDLVQSGHTIGNITPNFIVNDDILNLAFLENWQGIQCQLVEYFSSYEAGQEQDVLVGSRRVIAAYDFANIDQNIQRGRFHGVITDNPDISQKSFSPSCEAMLSLWYQAVLPSYLINSADFKRCPKNSLNRPGQINITSKDATQTEKLLILVDEGVSAVISTDYDEETTTFECDDLSAWDTSYIDMILQTGREKMQFKSKMVREDGSGTITVTRGYADTYPDTISEGSIIYEYRARETYLVGIGTLPTGQFGSGGDAEVWAISQSDDRERFKIPQNWYTGDDNNSSYESGETLTTIRTIRPLRVYGPSTEDENKELRTSDGNNYPTQRVEPKPGVVTVSADAVYTSSDFSEKVIIKSLLAGEDETEIIQDTEGSYGWQKKRSILGNTPSVSQFIGRPNWTIQGRGYYSMIITMLDAWGQGTGSIGTSGSTDNPPNYLKAQPFLSIENIDGDPPYIGQFYYRLNFKGSTAPNASFVSSGGSQSNDINGAQGELGYSSTPFFYSPLLKDMSTWQDFLDYPINIYIADTNEFDMTAPNGDNWGDAITKLRRVYFRLYLLSHMWSDPGLANVCDGNDATSETANGFLTTDFGPDCYYEETVDLNINGGAWPAAPGSVDLQGDLYIRILYKCTFTETSDDIFRITWDPDGNHGGPIDWNLHDSSLNISPGDQVEFIRNIATGYDTEQWDTNTVRIYTKLKKHGSAPITLYNIDISGSYVATGRGLWTTDEVFELGYLCGDLKHDGEKSYAHLMKQNRDGNYDDLDGVVSCKVSRRDLGFGLVSKVFLVISSQINKQKQGEPDPTRGGCLHFADGEYHEAAWAWYSHFNHRSGDFTGTDGSVGIGGTTLTSAGSTFSTWGVPGVQSNSERPGIVYIESGSNQGTYVIDYVDETHVYINTDYTHRWDNDKTAWTGFAATESDIKFKIHWPQPLDQTGDRITQELDITSQFTDIDADLDFNGYIEVRSKLFSESPTAPDPWVYNEDDAPYYDSEDNPSLFRLGMPKLKIVYNDGSVGIIVATHIDGINSGMNNPVTALDFIGKNFVGIDSDYFDSSSFDRVEGNITGIVDYQLTEQMSFRDFIRQMTLPFGFTIIDDGERLVYRDGSNPKVLSGTIITTDPEIRTYGLRPEFKREDLSGAASAATNPKNRAEENGYGNWAIITGNASTIGQVGPAPADGAPLSAGQYVMSFRFIGGSEVKFGCSPSTLFSKQLKITCWIKSYYGDACDITYNLIAEKTTDGGLINLLSITRSYAQSSGWHYIQLTSDAPPCSCLIDSFTIHGTNFVGGGAEPRIKVDDFDIFEKQDFERTNIVPTNVIGIAEIQSVRKWGPYITKLQFFYAVAPYVNTNALIIGGRRTSKSYSSYGDQYYSDLQDNYGVIPYPKKLEVLHQISDQTTALGWASILQRYTSGRWILVCNAPKNSLELADVVFVGSIKYFPQKHRGQYDLNKYFQVLTEGDVLTLVEVDDRFTNCLI